MEKRSDSTTFLVNSLTLYNKRTLAVMNSEKHYLYILKTLFIMTRVDKARNNISFICKRYYLDNLIRIRKN